MSKCLTIKPHGELAIEHAPQGTTEIPPALAAELEEAFARSSADGLLLLAGAGLAQELPAELAFWRDLARRLLQAVCQLGEAGLDQWKSVAPPADDELAQLVAQAPPMRGLEYLTADVLRRRWEELRELVAAQAAAFAGGAAAYLHHLNPVWQMLGRVTFHLAENKRDPDRPFAFLATYSHRLSQRSRVAHLPLAEALKTYAAASQRATLAALLAPVQRAAERSSLVAELLDSKALFAPQAWTIRQAYRFLKQSPQMEEAGVVVRLPDWWTARRPPRPQVQVQLGQRPPSEVGLDTLLDFRTSLALDGQTLTDAERDEILAATDGLVLLRGKWVEVDRQQIQQALDHWKQLQKQHADGIDFIQGMRLLSGATLDEHDAAAQPAAEWSSVVAGDWLRDTLLRLRQPAADAACRPGRDLRATLRPYQVEGVHWLWLVTGLGLGGCLADDMGLGKTIQVIDLLLQRRRAQARSASEGSDRNAPSTPRLRVGLVPRPSLLVVPASLLGNWRQELARFAPQLRAVFLHRSECDAAALARVAENPERELAGFDLAVTTYGLVRRQAWLARIRWSLVVLDEAQAIKNAASAQSRSVKKLPAASRLVLTGTPVENQLGDLWSLLDFCCPGLLGSAAQFKKFVKRLNQQQDGQAFGALRRLVRPYILRRLKTDPQIAPDLPDKTEMRTECGLSKQQAALYEQAVGQLARQLDKSEGIQRRGVVLSALMQLKQICNHPAQYLGRDRYPPEESGKFQRLRMLAEPIAERQEKALIFTQFQSLTQPLCEYLATVFGREGLVLHGGTPVRRRSELVRQFQDERGPPFFVISLKAGGSGLNLTAASHVIHFDRWWNPAVENQATDRAFRIGQKRNVLVHKFVCRGTVEERIDAMIVGKQDLARRVLDDDGEKPLTEMSDEELLRFVSLDIGRAVAEE